MRPCARSAMQPDISRLRWKWLNFRHGIACLMTAPAQRCRSAHGGCLHCSKYKRLCRDHNWSSLRSMRCFSGCSPRSASAKACASLRWVQPSGTKVWPRCSNAKDTAASTQWWITANLPCADRLSTSSPLHWSRGCGSISLVMNWKACGCSTPPLR